MNKKEEKKLLRAEYRRYRSELCGELRAERDGEICRRIISHKAFERAAALLLYYPIRGEINILPIAEEAMRCGKRVAYPICDSESHTMTFRYISALSELESGKYSIPEPPASAEAFCGGTDALCIVPGFAFDTEGFRLGYGGGYYDRFLKDFEGVSLGAIYEDCLCESLPRGYYDRRVDEIVTERRSFSSDGGKSKTKEKN